VKQYHNMFNRTDTTCRQMRMDMVVYLGGDHQPSNNCHGSRSQTMWITRCGSPGVLLCSTGWQPLRVSPLPDTQLLDHRPSLPTDMLERVLFCLGHCLAGHQKHRFPLCSGTTSAVASAVCRGRGTKPKFLKFSFFLGFRSPNLITGLSGWRTSD